MFEVDSRLLINSHEICDLDLCRVILKDESRFTIITLVPRRDGVKELFELTGNEKAMLMDEIDFVAKKMSNICRPDRINICCTNNEIEQLHVKLAARFKNDEMWPKAVFDLKKNISYAYEDLKLVIENLKNELCPDHN